MGTGPGGGDGHGDATGATPPAQPAAQTPAATSAWARFKRFLRRAPVVLLQWAGAVALLLAILGVLVGGAMLALDRVEGENTTSCPEQLGIGAPGRPAPQSRGVRADSLAGLLLALSGASPALAESGGRGGRRAGASRPRARRSADLARVGRPRWSLARPRNAKLTVALASPVEQAHKAAAWVNVKRVRGTRRPSLPRGAKVGAIVLPSLPANRSESMGFPLYAKAVRTRDGASVMVTVCVRRPADRSLSAPGRYTGRVRVAGPSLRSATIPYVVTIKAALPEMVGLALLVSLIGALGPFSSRPSEASREELKTLWQRFLALLPVVSGLLAGLLTAFLVYADDPTWGAQRGSDTINLLVAAYAASTLGLAATALPVRALRKRAADSLPPAPEGRRAPTRRDPAGDDAPAGA